jgi:hypothetical protein
MSFKSRVDLKVFLSKVERQTSSKSKIPWFSLTEIGPL